MPGWNHGWNRFVFGTCGDDTLTGGNRSEIIIAGGGDDLIDAGRGHDTVFGGWGDDTIDGGRGHDWLFGGSGDDSIDGGRGHDKIFGGCGDDILAGGTGHDIIFGGSGDDLLTGGRGGDYLNGGFGNDIASFVAADNGNRWDVYDGSYGFDTLRITLTQDEAADAAIQADLAAFQTFLDNNANPWTNYGPVFAFNSLKLVVQDFEALDIDILGGGGNTPPVALDDSATTDEDVAVNIDVLGNDSDVDGDALTVTSASAANGSVVIEADGTLTYLGNANFNGSDTISYTIDDGNGGTDTGSVAVTVNAVNDGPVAADDSATTDEDVAVNINVLGNDSDVDGDALTVTSASAANGSVVIEADGTLTYLGNANFNGSDTISYTIDDGNGGTDTASVAVTVNAVNDGPVAVDDAATTEVDQAVNIDVLSNDSDVDGDALTVTGASATNGSVVIEADGSLTYTGNAGFSGADTISYTIDDGNGGTDSADVVVTVNAAVTANADTNQIFASNATLRNAPTPPPADATGNVIDGGAHLNADLTPEKLNAETLVNSTTAGSQTQPDITTLTGGGYVVTWQNFTVGGDNDIVAQIFDANGAAVGGEIAVNTTTAGNQFRPKAVALDDGGFVILWDDFSGGVSDTNILAQRYDANGTATSPEFQIDTNSVTGLQREVQAVSVGADGFMVFWEDNEDADGDGAAVMTRTYALDNTSGPISIVNSTTADQQSVPHAATLADGNVAVMWQSREQDGDVTGLFGRILDSQGNALGAEFQVNTQSLGHQFTGDIAALTGGGFVAFWRDNGDPSSASELRFQLFDNAGGKIGVETKLSVDALFTPRDMDATGLPDGGFLLTWTSNDLEDTSGETMIGQRFDATGQPVSEEFLIATSTAGSQQQTISTLLPSGDLVSVWTDLTGMDGDQGGLFSHRFSLPEPSDGTADVADVDPLGGDLDVVALVSDNLPGNAATSPSAGVLEIDGAFGTLTIDQETGSYSYDLDDAAAAPLAEGQQAQDIFTYTIENGAGQQASSTLTVIVHGGNDAPVAADFGLTTTETALLSGDLFADNGFGTPFDPEGGALQVGSSFGLPLVGARTSDLPSGARLSIQNDGTFTYDPQGAFDHLQDGETGTDSFEVGILDADLGETFVTVTITITGSTSLITGTPGDDTLIGTIEADTIQGLGGNDSIDGAEGGDLLDGGDGNDSLFGGLGNNTLLGGLDDDQLTGGGDNDSLDGGGGNDTLTASNGDDALLGGAGADFLFGGRNNDTLEGGDGNDVLDGGREDDLLQGGAGDDTLDGDRDEDTLEGGAGNDSLLGDIGDDLLDGGIGDDALFGGSGRDTLNGGDGNDTLGGGSSLDLLFGGDGADSLSGSTSNDTLHGDQGNDTLNGGNQDDLLFGGDGDDQLRGGLDSDTLDGGAGDDQFIFDSGDGADVIDGFVTGAGSEDVLDFTASTINSIVDDGFGNTIINHGAGDTVLLTGVAAIDLHADDFV